MDRLARAGLTGREAAIVAAIARKTLGYNKSSDSLSSTQIASMTGISRGNVSELLAELEERHVIVRVGGRKGRRAEIALRLDCDWQSKTCPTGRTRQPDRSTGHLRLVNLSGSDEQPVRQTGSKPDRPTGHTRDQGVNRQGVDLQLVGADDDTPVGRLTAMYSGLPWDYEARIAKVVDLAQFPGRESSMHASALARVWAKNTAELIAAFKFNEALEATKEAA